MRVFENCAEKYVCTNEMGYNSRIGKLACPVLYSKDS
jgi:hypothetical protein